jgi:hypothetical protein
MKKKWIALLVALVILVGATPALAATQSKTTDDLTRVVKLETQTGKASSAIIWVEKEESDLAKAQMDAMKTFVAKKNSPSNFFPDATKKEIAALLPAGTDLTKLILSEYAALGIGEYTASYGDIIGTFQFPTEFAAGKTVAAVIGYIGSDGNVVWQALKTTVKDGNLVLEFPTDLMEKIGHDAILTVLSN